MTGAELLNDLWYERRHLPWLLWPLSLVYRVLLGARNWLFRLGVLATRDAGVPVIVVGNLTVGGTGKTPLIVWLAAALRERGWRVGVICRGYRGQAEEWPRIVGPDADPSEVGDEAVLLAERTGCPVAAGPDRFAAARALIEQHAVSIILSDDGLQHYALARTVEIAVVDGLRGFGNGMCLPAGPLREPAARLARVDGVVVNDGDWGHGGVFRTRMQPRHVRHVASGRTEALESFRGRHVQAVAAIGHPERFFRMLEDRGLLIERHALQDHAAIDEADLRFEDADDEPVVMTEKDAVKCRGFNDERLWYVVADLEFEHREGERLMRLIARRIEEGVRP